MRLHDLDLACCRCPSGQSLLAAYASTTTTCITTTPECCALATMASTSNGEHSHSPAHAPLEHRGQSILGDLLPQELSRDVLSASPPSQAPVESQSQGQQLPLPPATLL